MNRAKSDSAGAHVTTLVAARLLGMAVRSVQLMVDRGELLAWKTPGGHRRISRASLEEWLLRQRAGGAPAAAQSADGAPHTQRPTVLVIEDSQHYQHLLGLLVRQALPGADVEIAGDGIAGLAMAGRLEPELLLVDILLPGIDGAALITSLRSHPQFRASHLIVVTSLDEAQLEPFRFALHDVPVVFKTEMVRALPPLLRDALPEAVTPPLDAARQ